MFIAESFMVRNSARIFTFVLFYSSDGVDRPSILHLFLNLSLHQSIYLSIYPSILYRRESNLAISSSPVTKIMYRFYWHTTELIKRKEISSGAPGLSVMTLRECRVDRPFLVTWLGNVWESTPPPPAGPVKGLFNPRFPSLNLRYRDTVAWTCDWLFWFSLITDFINPNTIPFCNFKIGLQSKRLSSLAFCLTVLPVRAALSSVFFCKLLWE